MALEVDLRHRFGKRNYELTASVSGSVVGGTREAIALLQRDGVHRYQRPDDGLVLDTTRARAVVDEVVPRGKHLLHRFDSGWTLHTHLRMEGSWRVEAAGSEAARRSLRRPDLRAAIGNDDWTTLGLRLGELDVVRRDEDGPASVLASPGVPGGFFGDAAGRDDVLGDEHAQLYAGTADVLAPDGGLAGLLAHELALGQHGAGEALDLLDRDAGGVGHRLR